MSLFASAIAQVRQRRDLSSDETQQLIGSMLRGEANDEEVAELLLALRDKGEAVSELVGASRALRQHMSPIESPHEILLDTCGTGGDGSGSFNISTAAAIVVAAAGVPVAKHGNRKITSLSGSADVLRHLGVNVEAPRPIVQQCLAELGICFCYAPALHPAMKHVAQVRQKLGVRTLFNLLGPLCNPASATHQLLGTGDAAVQQKLAQALQALGVIRGAVVRGSDGLDEVTLSGTTQVLEVTPQQIIEHTWTPESFGFTTIDARALAAGDPASSAAVIQAILAGTQGPPRQIVIANAAAALWLAGRYNDLLDAADAASDAIDSGRAAKVLSRLGELTATLHPPV